MAGVRQQSQSLLGHDMPAKDGTHAVLDVEPAVGGGFSDRSQVFVSKRVEGRILEEDPIESQFAGEIEDAERIKSGVASGIGFQTELHESLLLRVTAALQGASPPCTLAIVQRTALTSMETLRCLGFGGIRSFGRVEDGCPQENVIGRAVADWQSLRVDSSDVMPLYHQLKPQIREQAKRLEPLRCSRPCVEVEVWPIDFGKSGDVELR